VRDAVRAVVALVAVIGLGYAALAAVVMPATAFATIVVLALT
jgi:hypothetical protein